jgi:tRNA U34 5-methylaminomethyl-2-thiouridine-forming methyltransferase MnmC
MTWRAVLTADGSFTLAHPVHGQTCHSRAGAWEEARERYARACRLAQRAAEISRSARVSGARPILRLLDVGTGLGLNLAAALEAVDGTDVALEAVSLEHDASVITAAIELFETLSPGQRASLPVGLERWHAPVLTALAAALAASARLARADGPAASAVPLGKGSLDLHIGDARSTLIDLPATVRFDAVFLDLFSPGVEPASWDQALLAEIGRRMSAGSWLSTFTTALAVRAGLRALGLRVGPGDRVGTKSGGTLATRGGEVAAFDPRTARRLEKRAARL